MASLDTGSPQLSVVKKAINAFISLDTKDLEHLLSKNYRHQSFPSSPDMPDEPKGEYIQRWGTCLSSVNKLDVVYHDVIEAQGQVVVFLTATFTTSDERKLAYDSVLIMSLIEEDGALKILNCKSFADVEKRNAVFDWVAKAQAQVPPVS